MELKDKIKELRKDAGLSQEELADKIYVSRSAIARWENGLGTPSEANMLELSKFFDVKLEEFGIEAKKEEPKSYNKFFLPLLITSITFFLLSIVLFITTICLSVNSKKESSTSNMKEVIEQIYAKKASVNGMNMDIFTYTLPEKEKSTTIQVKPTISKKDLLVANTTSKASSYTLSFLEEPSNVRAYYCEVDSEYNPIYTSLNSYREKSEWYNRTYLDAAVSNNIVSFSYDTAMACLVLEVSYSDVVIEYYILVK